MEEQHRLAVRADLGLAVAEHSGYVLIAWKGLRYESSLWVFLLLIALAAAGAAWLADQPGDVQALQRHALAILAEAALSYLGLGTQPPQPSWGRMLSDAQTLMFQAPLLAVFPGAAIALAVLGLNLLGDGLRDLLDPRLSRQRQ